jgi:hypothetical protein
MNLNWAIARGRGDDAAFALNRLDQKRSGIARDRTLQRVRPFREAEPDASVGFGPEERSTSFGEFASVCTEYYCVSGRRIRQAPSVTKLADSAEPACARALPLA